MENKLGQEPAFACKCMSANGNDRHIQEGMSQRVYAAIQLQVPNSGEEWLDEMIRKANRREAACAAMQGLLSNSDWTKSANIPDDFDEYKERIVSASYEFSDELLKQINK